MEELNVKVISSSCPGHGGSDSQPYRRISDWPTTDLEPVLYHEGVHKFLVIGTAHAMATAACFPKHCLAMGLNVPYLPEPICREFGLHTDADMILREAQLQKPWYLLPILSLLSMFQGVIGEAGALIAEGPETKKRNPEILKTLANDCRRSFLRGVLGQAYEMANIETTQHWQDPRAASFAVPVVRVWYAEDDSLCPSDHGK